MIRALAQPPLFALLAAAAVIAGCTFDRRPPDGLVSCADGACPAGYVCVPGKLGKICCADPSCKGVAIDLVASGGTGTGTGTGTGKGGTGSGGAGGAPITGTGGDGMGGTGGGNGTGGASEDAPVALPDTGGEAACTPECALNARRCAMGKLQTCTDANGCPAWAAGSDCPAGQSCAGDAPAAACQCPPPPPGCGSGPGIACEGAGLAVECLRDANGCLTVRRTTCPQGKPCTGAFPGASCSCPSPPPECQGRDAFCASDARLGRCVADAVTTCMSITFRDCAARETCRASGSSASCACNGTVCSNTCVDLKTNQSHCGACGNDCKSGTTCCDGKCVNPSNDSANCGTCGNRCATGQRCQGGNCVCAPTCEGKACGANDGCGRACTTGSCPANHRCTTTNGIPMCTSTCVPMTDAQACAAQSRQCGPATVSDCNGSRTIPSCGMCPVNHACNAAGRCICQPQTNAELCKAANRECGPLTTTDRCNVMRTIPECAVAPCPRPTTCNAQGQCTCVSQPDPNPCATHSKNCGMFTYNDNCLRPQTVNCGTCTAPQTCSNNVCGCAAESDEAFCARLGRDCGVASGTDNCGRSRTVVDCGLCISPDRCVAGRCRACTRPPCPQPE